MKGVSSQGDGLVDVVHYPWSELKQSFVVEQPVHPVKISVVHDQAEQQAYGYPPPGYASIAV